MLNLDVHIVQTKLFLNQSSQPLLSIVITWGTLILISPSGAQPEHWDFLKASQMIYTYSQIRGQLDYTRDPLKLY